MLRNLLFLSANLAPDLISDQRQFPCRFWNKTGFKYTSALVRLVRVSSLAVPSLPYL